jgi:Chitin binding Peritrophin-A domain
LSSLYIPIQRLRVRLGAYPRKEHLKDASFGAGSNLTDIHYTRLERHARDKRSIQLLTFVNYAHKKFYNIGGSRTEIEPPISAPNCPRLFGTFPDTDDCTGFFNCRDGLSNRYSCAPGLAFDPKDRVCKWADQVRVRLNSFSAQGEMCLYAASFNSLV